MKPEPNIMSALGDVKDLVAAVHMAAADMEHERERRAIRLVIELLETRVDHVISIAADLQKRRPTLVE